MATEDLRIEHIRTSMLLMDRYEYVSTINSLRNRTIYLTAYALFAIGMVLLVVEAMFSPFSVGESPSHLAATLLSFSAYCVLSLFGDVSRISSIMRGCIMKTDSRIDRFHETSSIRKFDCDKQLASLKINNLLSMRFLFRRCYRYSQMDVIACVVSHAVYWQFLMVLSWIVFGDSIGVRNTLVLGLGLFWWAFLPIFMLLSVIFVLSTCMFALARDVKICDQSSDN